MSSLDDHPTVRRLRAGSAQESTVEQNPLNSGSLRRIAPECGADDCGLVRIDDPALGEERDHVLRAFPGTRTLLAIVRRMYRGPVRSPARSLANLEFHRTGNDVDEIARKIVRYLEDRKIGAVTAAAAFPMELDQFPGRGWIVSHKIVAQAAGLGRMGIHRSLIHPKYGSFVLLGTVLIAADVDTASAPLDYNPVSSVSSASRPARSAQSSRMGTSISHPATHTITSSLWVVSRTG